MGLETGTYISDLVATNPTASDPVAQGDDHTRLLKSTIKASFPNINGAVTPTPAQLNRLTGSNHLVIDRAYAEYTTSADISTAIPLDDTIPQNTEGTQIISVALTPKSTTNRVRLRFQGQVYSAGGAVNVIAAVFSSASANALRATVVSTGGAGFSAEVVLEHEYVPASTSAQTYTVRIGSQAAATIRMNGGAARLFGGVSAATLIVEEITAS